MLTDRHGLAHGVGGREDLPIPASYAFMAAAFVLLVSFVVLAFAWRSPRFDGRGSGRPLPVGLAGLVDSPVTRCAVVVLGLAFSARVTAAAVFGRDTLVNPTFGTIMCSCGSVWSQPPFFRTDLPAVQPVRWLHRGICGLAGLNRERGLIDYPRRLGLWPAAFFLFCFVWLELIDPSISTSLSAVRLWFAAVIVLLLMGAKIFGDTWLGHADPFEV